MFFLRGRGLGDYIDANDPCTKDPSDPICQATASDVAADPCTANPYASYCQASIVTQSSSLPTPGANDSQWNQYVQGGGGATSTTIAAVIAAIGGAAGGQKPTPAAATPGAGITSTMGAQLGMPNKYVLGAILLLGAGLLVHRQREMRAAKRRAA